MRAAVTADVLSLDGARISARERLELDRLIDLQPVLSRLERQVLQKAHEMFGDAARKHYLYITFEAVVEPPNSGPAA